jgi:hypothetical protein
MARSDDSPSAVRVSVSVLRFEDVSCGGSMLLGPTPVSRSQFAYPGSVEPASTCGSCMSAPEDGARVSGTQAAEDVVTAAVVGSDCGLNVDLYIVGLADATAPAGAEKECRAGCVVVRGGAGIVCGACDVVWIDTGVVAGKVKGSVGMTLNV